MPVQVPTIIIDDDSLIRPSKRPRLRQELHTTDKVIDRNATNLLSSQLYEPPQEISDDTTVCFGMVRPLGLPA